MTDLQGNPVIKTFKLLTNSAEIATEQDKRLTPEQKLYCEPLEGRNVTHSQEYPVKMVRAILRGLTREAKRRSPHRFEPYKIFVAQPGGTEDEWLQLLDQVKKIFQNSSVKSMNVPDGHETFRKVSTMISWILTRVQLAVTPQMRRMPRDVEYTHRGGAIGYTDGTLTLEYECLSGVDFPKQKFERSSGSATQRRRRPWRRTTLKTTQLCLRQA